MQPFKTKKFLQPAESSAILKFVIIFVVSAECYSYISFVDVMVLFYGNPFQTEKQ